MLAGLGPELLRLEDDESVGLGMGHTPFILGCRFVDCYRDLLDSQLRGGGSISRGEHAPGGRQLDPVRSGAQHLADRVADRVFAIGYTVGNIGQVNAEESQVDATGIEAIAMPARLLERRAG